MALLLIQYTVIRSFDIIYVIFSSDLYFPYLQTIVLARSPHHVPLATRLLRGLVVDVASKATPHLIIRVLRQVFRQVAGALAPGNRRDYSGI